MSVVRRTWTDSTGSPSSGTIIDNAELQRIYDDVDARWTVQTITTTGSVISYADGMNEGSNIILNSDTTQLEVLAGDAATQSGVISETGGARPLEKIGDGKLTVTGSNTYTGLTTISAGVLNVQNVTGLGTTAAGTTVVDGAALEIQGGISIGAEALTLNGSGISGGGALRSAGFALSAGLSLLTVPLMVVGLRFR